MNSTFLEMIGHGTTGSDGIEEGIHLRWSFDDKLGFPECFKLYRRKSDRNDRFDLPVQQLDGGSFSLPQTFHLHQIPAFSFTLELPRTNNTTDNEINIHSQQLDDGSTLRYMEINGELIIRFSEPVNRIEMQYLLQAFSDFNIIIVSDDGRYEPYSVKPGSIATKAIAFDTKAATAVILSGDGIQLAALSTWIVKAGGGWQRLNDYCGCGLPVNTAGTPYTDDVYQGMGKDLAMALCRMGFRRVQDSPITAAQFIEFKAMLLTMQGEGIITPVGWTLFPNDEEESESALEMSKYDFLLTQSLQVYFAKILGLFWTDTTAAAGEYYDYKITAEWPETNLRRLTQERLFDGYETGYLFPPIVSLDSNMVMVAPKSSVVTAFPVPLFRTTKALEFNLAALPVLISFQKPVTEIQIVLINPAFAEGASIRVEAYTNSFTAYADREELLIEKGLLRLRAEQIDSIKIFGDTFLICSIRYEESPFPVGEQQYVAGGIKKQDHLAAAIPAELTATSMRGGTVNYDDGRIQERPHLAGLRWLVNADPGANLIPLVPVLYHIERQTTDGTTVLITANAPLFIATSALQQNKKDIPAGWPPERQFFTERLTVNAQNSYRIAAIDLFGRQSGWTPFASCQIIHPAPPPPENVRAKFLDYTCYDSATNTFTDQTLDDTDKAWLKTHRHNAIRVAWEWPENLQLQAPSTAGFRVHYKQGWLNNYTGVIATEIIETTITKTSLTFTPEELAKFPLLQQRPEQLPVHRFRITLDSYAPPPPRAEIPLRINERDFLPENAFRLCWLTQGVHQFLILKNSTEREPFIWVLTLNDVPVIDKGFGIAVTAGKPSFINYRLAENWIDTNVFHEEAEQGIESYNVYLENPAFPDPAIQPQDLNKVRYAQIGVSAFTDDLEGAVATPATIMAVFRNKPATPAAFIPAAADNITGLTATRANVHGKSSFALRWNKSVDAAGYHVFRTLDETLMKTNNSHIRGRTQQVYDDFANAYPVFAAADLDVIRQIPYEANHKRLQSHYTALTPGQWQILASIEDNENAFTRINDEMISPDDAAYYDSITDVPDPVNGSLYMPDPTHVLLYVDATLNGLSSNRAFYGIRCVDSNGLQSALSLSTPPVLVPVSIPPPAPVITSISGGHNSITIKWAKNPGAIIHGYLLYRTTDKTKATDYRKMEVVKTNATDEFTVAVDGASPAAGFEYKDNAVSALQTYYYGLAAVRLNDVNKRLQSALSGTVESMAYDQTPPEPPVWDELNSGWIYLDDNGEIYDWREDLSGAQSPVPAIRLVWQPVNVSDTTLISKAEGLSSVNKIVMPFQTSDFFDDTKQFFIDTNVHEGTTYQYSAQSRSSAMLPSIERSLVTIIPEN